MKIKTLKIKNFRAFKEEVSIDFEDLTAIVGRNDIGKSSIMEALDIFFNEGKGVIKLDKEDINKEGIAGGDNEICISVSFVDWPTKIVIDESNETTLAAEYLLNERKELEVLKIFKNASTSTSGMKVCIRAMHPTNSECNNLLHKKQAELNSMLDKYGLSCEDRRRNALMRAAIWGKFELEDSLELGNVHIEINSKDGDIKAIWSKLQSYMPYFSLFQSDRKNVDADSEVQDPLKEAVKQLMREPDIKDKLQYVADHVRTKLQEVSDMTLSKIREMNEDIANSLHPQVPASDELKWADVFKNLSITSDEDIPINKRGSGVRRLILLNFFRAEAERRQREQAHDHTIYAIEEPETSQHKAHQMILIEALKELSKGGNAQIIITTHSPDIVKALRFEQIKLVYEDSGIRKVKTVEAKSLPYPSLNEINFLAFDDASEEYHNELYGFLQLKAIDEDPKNEKEKEFEAWLVSKGCSQNKSWIRLRGGAASPAMPCTIQTYIRNYIHHPENTYNAKYSNIDLRNSIEKMKEIINIL